MTELTVLLEFLSNASIGWLIAGLLLIGLIVGSFLNVVILRFPIMLFRQWKMDAEELDQFLPKHEALENLDQPYDLIKPASHCRHCLSSVKPWQNIPIISFLLLRGRCQQCQQTIGWRYPVVEGLTALLSAMLLINVELGLPLAALLVFTWVLIALSVIDIDHQILPDQLTLPLMWLGLLLNTQSLFVPLEDAVMGAALGYMSLWTVYWVFKLLTGKDGMGAGDFKLLAALGAWLGWSAIPMIILLSSLVGAIVGILMVVLSTHQRDNPIPFGPYLAAAGYLSAVWGDSILDGYLATFKLI